jgi:uncharacterized membrane protein YbhN (UPF0104 family)
LAWVLHDANIGQLRYEIERLNWWWIAAAMASDLLVYVWDAWRWTLLLTPVQPVSFWHTLRAVYVGLFANEVLPLRAGEVIRCFLQSRWNHVPLSISLATHLIERIFDGVWLMACLFLTIRMAPRVPKFVVDGGFVLGLLVVVTAIFLAIAMYWKEQTLDTLARAKWLGWVHALVKDLHLIGHSRYLYFAALISLPYLLMQVLPIYGVIRAYQQLDDLSLLAAFTMMVILRLGSVVPQAPGNLGAYQFLTVVSLLLFGVHHGLAKRFSLVLWAVITVPMLVVGFLALALTGVRMHTLHREAQAKMSAQAAPAVSGRQGS